MRTVRSGVTFPYKNLSWIPVAAVGTRCIILSMRRHLLLPLLVCTACSSRPPAEAAMAADLTAFPDIVVPSAPWRLAEAPPASRLVMGPVRVLEARFAGGPPADLMDLAQAQSAGGWAVLRREDGAISLAKDREVLRIAAGPELVYTLETRP
jgi:hypothetical protein